MPDKAEKVILGALSLSISLRGVEIWVRAMGERHPYSKAYPRLDRALDHADAIFGWFGDLVRAIVFTRRDL
jgi:hypothetical protein